MAKGKKKAAEGSMPPHSIGQGYVCISAHNKHFTREDDGKGFKAYTVGQIEVFKENPGPCWSLEEETKKTEEVTGDGTGE